LQENGVANGESRFGNWRANHLIPAQCVTYKGACTDRPIRSIDDHKGRPSLQVPKSERHSLPVCGIGIRSPLPKNQIETCRLIDVSWSPLHEICCNRCIALIDIAPNTPGHISATTARSERPLIIGIDYKLQVRLRCHRRSRIDYSEFSADVKKGTVQRGFARLGSEMPAKLPQVLSTLHQHEDELRRRGVCHAAVFGSVARGESRIDSDIDVLVDLDPHRPMGLFEYARVRLYIAELLGGSADVVNRKTLKPLLRDAILRDAVNAF